MPTNDQLPNIIVKFRDGLGFLNQGNQGLDAQFPLDEFENVLDDPGSEFWVYQSFPRLALKLQAGWGTPPTPGTARRLDLYANVRPLLRMSEQAIATLVKRLEVVDVVQYAVAGGRVQAAVNCDDSNEMIGDFVPCQRYLESALKGGVDARCAWEVGGGKGSEIQICVVDTGFAIDHPNLPSVTYDTSVDFPEEHTKHTHGNQSIGVIAGTSKSNGISGICPEMGEVHFVSFINQLQFTDDTGAIDRNLLRTEQPLEGAIDLAVEALTPGDVIVVEVDVIPPTVDARVPLEWQPHLRDFFLEMTSVMQLVVVASAGNGVELTIPYVSNKGGVDLSTVLGPDLTYFPSDTGPTRDMEIWRSVSGDENPNDSGAIIVGAGRGRDGTPITSKPADMHSSMATEYLEGATTLTIPLYNFGERVTCQGWGELVTTCGGVDAGDLFQDSCGDADSPGASYTRSFFATSSATAIVAGVVASLQSAYKKANGGATLSSIEIRSLLYQDEFGSPQSDPENGRIGPLPDLRRLLASDGIGIHVDVFVRDNLADTGALPSTGSSVYSSPDIMVRTDEPAEEALVGAGWDEEFTATVERGTANNVYVQVHNRGTVEARGVNVDVFHSESSTFLHPSRWIRIGGLTDVSVDSGGTRAAGPIVWEAPIDLPDHFCLIAVVESCCDPLVVDEWPRKVQDLVDFATAAEYKDFLREQNNVAHRNVNSVPYDASAQMSFSFLVRGFPSREDVEELGDVFRLEFTRDVPGDARVVLRFDQPIEIRDRDGATHTWDGLDDKNEHEWTTDCPIVIENVCLAAEAKVRVDVDVSMETMPDRTYMIRAEQFHEDDRLGVVTNEVVPDTHVRTV